MGIRSLPLVPTIGTLYFEEIKTLSVPGFGGPDIAALIWDAVEKNIGRH
jgi:hypothetical protein